MWTIGHVFVLVVQEWLQWGEILLGDALVLVGVHDINQENHLPILLVIDMEDLRLYRLLARGGENTENAQNGDVNVTVV